MFTGIVQSVARVCAVSTCDGELTIELGLEVIGENISIGDSVSVSGVCLTVARLSVTVWLLMYRERLCRGPIWASCLKGVG